MNSIFDDGVEEDDVVTGLREEAKVTRTPSGLVISWRLLSAAGEVEWQNAAEYDSATGILRTFVGFDEQVDQKVHGVREIRFDTACLPHWSAETPLGEHERYGTLQIEGLPLGFNGSFRFGLGIARSYGDFLRMIEDHTNVSALSFGNDQNEGVDGDTLHLKLERFEQFRRLVDLNKDRGRTVVARINRAEAHNAFTDLFGTEEIRPTEGRNEVIVAITRELTGEKPLDDDDRAMLVGQVLRESHTVARESPQVFGMLRDDIQLVSLDVLIEQFQQQLGGPGAAKEDVWQEFFKNNVFALQQLFSAPVDLYNNETGSLRVSIGNDLGQGQRIADFVLANVVTRTTYVIEIKTPATRLLGSPYRGRGDAEVHPASKDLAGAVAQVQSQVESIRTELPHLQQNRRDAAPLETYSVRAAVIAGKAADLDDAQRASLRRFRDGLHDVEVVTYDEVLERLRGLHAMLTEHREPSPAASA